MATIYQRLHRHGTGNGYDVLYFETASSIVMRPNGENVEKTLATLCGTAPKVSTTVPSTLAPGATVIVGKAVYIGDANSEPLRLATESAAAVIADQAAADNTGSTLYVEDIGLGAGSDDE